MDASSLNRLKEHLSEHAERLKDVLSRDEDSDFADVLEDETVERDFQDDAAIISTALIEEFDPDTVFEIGCGIGLHLKPFLDQGIEANGVDESNVAHENAVIPAKHIEIQDLRAYDPGQVHDLVICIDLLEYTSRSREDTFIESIAGTGRIAVVSVPLPRYSNLRYDHEEPKQYWVKKFQEHGMRYDPEATRHVQDRIEADEEAWVPEQLMVFRKQ